MPELAFVLMLSEEMICRASATVGAAGSVEWCLLGKGMICKQPDCSHTLFVLVSGFSHFGRLYAASINRKSPSLSQIRADTLVNCKKAKWPFEPLYSTYAYSPP